MKNAVNMYRMHENKEFLVNTAMHHRATWLVLWLLSDVSRHMTEYPSRKQSSHHNLESENAMVR